MKLSKRLSEPLVNRDKDLIFQFYYKQRGALECSKLSIDLAQSSYEAPESGADVAKLSFGVELCGSFQKVNIQFFYQERILDWQRYVRPHTDLSSVDDFLKSMENEGGFLEPTLTSESVFHRLRLTIYTNNTYSLAIDDEVVVTPEA